MFEAPSFDNGEHEAISKLAECFIKFWDVALFLYKGRYLEPQKSTGRYLEPQEPTESQVIFVQTKFIRP